MSRVLRGNGESISLLLLEKRAIQRKGPGTDWNAAWRNSRWGKENCQVLINALINAQIVEVQSGGKEDRELVRFGDKPGVENYFLLTSTYRALDGCVEVAYAHGEHMRFLQNCGFLLLTFMVASCERHRSGGCPHDATIRTYQQWAKSVSFPYTAPQIRKERIVKNVEKIRVGSTKEEVVAVLGEPDYEQEMNPKEPNRPCIGYEFAYYLEKPENLANETRDKGVEVYFSPAGKATKIFGNISEKDRPPTK